jgi:uncharacterized protein YkwD
LPTSTPYPLQPTYTPLPTATSYAAPITTATSLVTATMPASLVLTATTSTMSTESTSEAARLVDMQEAINRARADAGCPPAVLDQRLQTAAARHAQDIAARGMIDHAGANGSTLQERLAAVGYPFERRSELIGRGSQHAVMDAWLAEPSNGPHRGSIADCEYTDDGIGLSVPSDGRQYWVVDLANTR